MELRRLGARDMDALWELHVKYKEEIGEEIPDDLCRERLEDAVNGGHIMFFGALDEGRLTGICSVTVGFSTFDYSPSGVFEDFFILPEYRHKGIARSLVGYAYMESGVSSMTVGCADCDIGLYASLGFTIPLGNLLALE